MSAAVDLGGPLPDRPILVEASAGTGKTYTIATWTTWLLAEGTVTISQMLVVTFSRAATQELRQRIRVRILEAIIALESTPAVPGDITDEPTRRLCTGAPEVLAKRLHRLRQALLAFDDAPIMTTHQFCQHMLEELGVWTSYEPGRHLLEDPEFLIRQIALDRYLRNFAHVGIEPPFPFDNPQPNRWKGSPPAAEDSGPGAWGLAKAALTDRTTALVRPAKNPEDPPLTTVTSAYAQQRTRFSAWCRDDFNRRTRTLRLYTHDDQLTELRDALVDPVTGPAACQKLRRRYPVVLVDEFQDTDPVQWQILQTAFGTSHPLIVVGDPKQAIYRFRGADVECYLDAARHLTARTALTTNYRADPGIVSALAGLFRGLSLGRDIEVGTVTAHRTTGRLTWRQTGLPFTAMIVRQLAVDKAGPESQVHRVIDDDVVRQIIRLRDGGLVLTGDDGQPRPVELQDIAVLVSTNRRGAQIRQALQAARIPAVFSGTASVFGSTAAGQLLTLLQAMTERAPYSLRAALLTDFFGLTFAQIATASETDLAHWGTTLYEWSLVADRDGIAALWDRVAAAPGITSRIMRAEDAERTLVDYRHLVDLLQRKTTDESWRLPALVHWFAQMVTQSGDANSERNRRLETDASAVQILTVHASKGLEFPLVLLPEVAETRSHPDYGGPLTFHDDSGKRWLDTGGTTDEQRPARFQRSRQEEADESLRQLYVAFTRAQCHVTCWWAPIKDRLEQSPLQRVLYRDRQTGGTPRLHYPFRPDLGPDRLPWLTSIAAVEVFTPGHRPDRPPIKPDRPIPATMIRARQFHRDIDREWRRTSYSGLTAGTHALAGVARAELAAQRASDDEMMDEPDVEVARPATAGPTIASPMANLPGGTRFGNLVHAVYEQVRAESDDLVAEVGRVVPGLLLRYPMGEVTPQQLTAALLPSFTTPLGGVLRQRCLRDFDARHRVCELEFELPLGSRDAGATLLDIAALLSRRLPASDPFAGYPAALTDLADGGARLRGFLTGSIDAVLRTGTTGRYVIIDYKTNILGPVGDITIDDYHPRAMTEAMITSHYPLQALLYSAALHRLLSQRLPGYQPERQLGGVLYLFVRGMNGPDTPRTSGMTYGVFNWQPDPALIVELSELLAKGAQRAR